MPLLERHANPADWVARIGADPLEFPRRYQDALDIEVSGLLAASLAYGRADLFRPKIDGVLRALGPSPSQAVRALTVRGAAKLLDGWVYRFNLGADLAVLLMGMGALQRDAGSLDAAFARGLTSPFDLHASLAAFAGAVRDAAPRRELERAMGKPRALQHLLPVKGGASKRLLLYLRWMVRGPDAVDLGVWTSVRKSQLVVPLDTHVARVSRWLGLTQRKDLSWRTAVDITASLRAFDPEDPVRFDFALCHFGMSGACPVKPRADNCARCPLKGECRVGRRLAPARSPAPVRRRAGS